MKPTIQNEKVYDFTTCIVACYYPLLNRVVNFCFAERKNINKDEFMAGMWKLKNLKK
jgi:hypothetical protein